MWLPRNKLFSTENFSTHATGDYTYTDFDAQNNIGGVVGLRNIATGLTVTVTAGEPWPSVAFNTQHDFDMLWSASSGDFSTTGGAPTQNLSYGTISLINDDGIYSTGNMAFDTGVLFESEMMISRLTGSTTGVDNLYGLFFQYTGAGTEGFETVTLHREPNPGFIIGKGATHETFVPVTGLASQVIGFRYGIRGTTGHFVTTDGYSTYITGLSLRTAVDMTGLGYGSTDSNSWLLVGDLTPIFTGSQVDATSRIEVGKLYEKSPVYDIAGDFIADTLYATGLQKFTTSSFKPEVVPEHWEKAYYKLIGADNGNTQVHAEYTNDGTTYTTGASSAVHSATGLFSVDLSAIPISASTPENAEIRFSVEQQSADGTTPPVQVDYITTVFSSPSAGNFMYLDPSVGSAVGEYPVLISIDPFDLSHMKQPTTGDALFFAPLTGTATDTAFIDLVSAVSGDTTDTGNVLTSVFSNDSKAFRTYTGFSNSLTGIFESFPGVVNIQAQSQYTTIQSGPQTYLATRGAQYLFPTGEGTGVSTGVYTGTIGSQLSWFDYPGAAAGTNDLLSVTQLTYADAGKVNTYAAQRYAGSAGHGFQTPNLGASGMPDDYLLIEAIVQVTKGAVAFAVNETTADHALDPAYPVYRYGSPQRVYSVVPMPTGNVTIEIYGLSDNMSALDGAGSEFTVADMAVYGLNNDAITWTGNPITHTSSSTEMYMDAWVKIDGHSKKTGIYDSHIMRFTGDSYDVIAGLDGHGIPYLTTTTGTTTQYITGHFGVKPDRWYHLAWQESDYCSLFVDGELCAYEPRTVTIVPNTGDAIVGAGFVGAISNPRILTGSYNPVKIASDYAFDAPVKFQTWYQLPTGSAEMLYRFDKGTLWDIGNTGRAIIPERKYTRTWTERDAEGVFGEGIEFNGRYGHASGAVDANISSTQGWIGMWVAALGGDDLATPRVFQIGDAKLDLYQAKYPRYTYSGNTYTGSEDITQMFGYGWLTIEHRVNGGNTDIVCNWSTGQSAAAQMFSGQMAGNSFELTGQLFFGHDPDVDTDHTPVFLDEFAIYTGGFPTGHTGNYMNVEYQKATPGETVYLNNTALTGTRVSHVGVYDKEIIMPAQSSFDLTGATVQFSVDTLAGRKVIHPSFTYLGVRKIVLDTGSFGAFAEARDKLCRTKSPFRIGGQVPADGVNLAFISSPEFSVDNNVGFVDNAGNISDSHVSSLKAYENMSAFQGTEATGDGASNKFLYSGEADTDDILLTTYTMLRKDAGFAAPMFYKYKLGGQALFTYQVGATGDTLNSTDVELIRNSIRITDQDGANVPLVDYPWDVRISKQREDSVVLPTNVYNVEVLSRDRFIQNRSLFVEFNAANPLNDYAQVKGWRECLNPEPIYRHVKEDSSLQETFSTVDSINFNEVSSSRFNAGPVVTVNELTGSWAPYIHSSLLHDDDYII